MAPACHDTGSAVAAVEANAKSAFLSSGTWSILGAEVQEPMLTPSACELNFTNEGGVCGTVRHPQKHRRALAAPIMPEKLGRFGQGYLV